MNKLTHVSVLLTEAIDALGLQPDSIVIDGTFGRGGHSRAILSALGEKGSLVAIDRDPEAIAAAQDIDDPRFSIIQAPFSEIDSVAADVGIEAADAVLLDLGVSSPQLDDASRGFTFQKDAFLDMRMDPTTGETAQAWLAKADLTDIQRALRIYGEERFAKQIAQAIINFRKSERLDTTGQLADLVASVVRTRERGKNPATRTFQAVRIVINRELEELQIALPKAFNLLKAGGRLVVISFHSLEDRIVKQFMTALVKPTDVPSDLPLRENQLPKPKARWVIKKVMPSEKERSDNIRSRSAVLRAIEKVSDEACSV